MTDVYTEGGDLTRTEYDFEVSAGSLEEVMVVAYEQAKALFGDRAFELRSVDVRPGIQNVRSGVIVYFASVSAVTT